MNIILSTYNFYPFRKGGTEVYTKALASYLIANDHKVLVIAAMDDDASVLKDSNIWLDDSEMKAVVYCYEEINVLSVRLKNQLTEDIYINEKNIWTTSFLQLLKTQGWAHVDHLVLNGFSTVSGLSLCNAVRRLNSAVRINVVVHTPFICPKADMIFAGTGSRCEKQSLPGVCAACLMTTHSGISYSVNRMLTLFINLTFLPVITKSTGVRLQSLLKKKVDGFKKLDEWIHSWIVFSEDMKNFFSRQSFITSDKVWVLRHGIDKTVFYEGEATPPAPILFLYAGRFEEIKGVNVLADAWQKLEDQPEVRVLHLAGDWRESITGKEIVAKLGNRKDVKFIDTLSHQQLAIQYRKTHCVIIPSKWVETGPMVFHEAIACGCDIISSDIGGQGELVNVYRNKAFPFNSGKAESLYQVIVNYKPSGKGKLYEPMSWNEHFQNLTERLNIA